MWNLCGWSPQNCDFSLKDQFSKQNRSPRTNPANITDRGSSHPYPFPKDVKLTFVFPISKPKIDLQNKNITCQRMSKPVTLPRSQFRWYRAWRAPMASPVWSIAGWCQGSAAAVGHCQWRSSPPPARAVANEGLRWHKWPSPHPAVPERNQWFKEIH